MKLISNYIYVNKVRSELEPVLHSLGSKSYRADPTTALYSLTDYARKYLANRKNREDIVDGYKEVGNSERKYILVLLYTLLTHHTGGTEYGYMGELNGKGQDAVKLAALLYKRLIEQGYFQNEDDAKADFDDFVKHFKRLT